MRFAFDLNTQVSLLLLINSNSLKILDLEFRLRKQSLMFKGIIKYHGSQLHFYVYVYWEVNVLRLSVNIKDWWNADFMVVRKWFKRKCNSKKHYFVYKTMYACGCDDNLPINNSCNKLGLGRVLEVGSKTLPEIWFTFVL